MAAIAEAKGLLSAAVYLSTGRQTLAASVARAASAAASRAAVVDTFTDTAYSRASVKLVGSADDLLQAAEAAATEALRVLDLAEQPQPAPHPRQGAVDMISFMPLSERKHGDIAEELSACDALAWRLGEALGRRGVPVLMYGARAGRTLVETRKGTTFFQSVKEAVPAAATLPPDFGPGGAPPPKWGVAIVGSQSYVTNYNVAVANASLEDGRAAAAAVRSAFGVQVMALPHAADDFEVGCNLQASDDRDSPLVEDVLACVEGSLPAGATIKEGYVIGLAPADALRRGEEALAEEPGARYLYRRVLAPHFNPEMTPDAPEPGAPEGDIPGAGGV
mmetsp:Transcript_2334/g.7205  ORF Transcript_2334/g.7205 Transcript_2334/m.7205 type:complete len:334 (-) Transcript_2334:16-1017(-)